MGPDDLLDLLHGAAGAVREALEASDDWDLAGTVAGQYHSDLVADRAAGEVLDRAGVGVLSEESGLRGADREVLVVVDPLDGSTNASLRIPWYATSLCALDGDGPLAALVVNLASGDRFEAVRGGGVRRNGRPVRPSITEVLAEAVVGISGYPDRSLGWRQYRALGAAALDLCLVASGGLDGYVDCSGDAHGVWDYAAAILICREAGASIVDAHGRDLLVRSHEARRTPVAAATPALLEELLFARDEAISRRPPG